MDGDAIPPPPKPKQHYFKRGTAFLKKKGYWAAWCPHCDAEIAASRPEKVSQQRQTHLRRWHPGLPRMGYHTKTPPPEEVLPEGVPWTVAWLFKVTNKHREAMHPRVSAEAYRIKQISAHKATPAKRQSKRIENLNAAAATSFKLAKLGYTHFLMPVVRRARTVREGVERLNTSVLTPDVTQTCSVFLEED